MDQPRPPDHLTRGEKAKLRAALIARLAEDDPLRWTVVESVLYNVVRRVFEPDWRGPHGPRAIIEMSYTDFFVADIGISAPFEQGTDSPSPTPVRTAMAPSAQPPVNAQAANSRSTKSQPSQVQIVEAPATAAQAGKAHDPATSSAKTQIPTAAEAKERSAKGSTLKPRTTKTQGPPATPAKATERKTAGSASTRSQTGKRQTSTSRQPQTEAPHPDDVRRVSSAMLAEFTLNNPLTLDAVAEIVKNKSPRLYGLTNGSKRRLVEVLRTSFSPIEVFEVERGRHWVYRDAGITDHEQEQAWVALDAELTRNGALRLRTAAEVLLQAMPRVSAPEWAGAGSPSAFLQMYFAEDFKIDNRPDGPYVVRVRNGILDRLWRRRQDTAR